MKAKKLLDAVYDVYLQPDKSYRAQLEKLAPTGELANMKSLIDVLIGLCEICDEIEAKLDKLDQIRYATPNPTGSDTGEPV